MTVVIAGSTGLVGTALMKAFKNSGEEVIGINRKVLDLTDSRKTSDFIRSHRPEIVVDAAALVGGIAANNSRPVEFLTQNLQIQNNLMSAAFEAQVPKFVFLGSSCIYPKDAPQPIKEEYLLTGPLEETNSAYAIAKIAGIEMLNSYRKEYGTRWISILPSNLYGPSDNFNLETSHVLPALLMKFLEATNHGDEFVEVWGTGKPRREFLHVDDLVSAVLIALDCYDSSLHLNVGTGIDISISELAIKIARIVGYDGEIYWDTGRPDGTSQKVLDVSRISSLGWSPKITLDEGILSTLTWLQIAMEKGEVRL
jgi:GDP-L-fucose synthase